MSSKCQTASYVHHTLTLPSVLPCDPPVTISALLHPSMIPLLPNSPRSVEIPKEPPYKVVQTTNRGFGAFASRAIEAGALIALEHPLFVIPVVPLPKDAGFELYEGVGKRMLAPDYEKVTKLANCRRKEECPSIIEGAARTNALNLQFNFPDSFDGSKHYGGTFPTIGARNNHSCGPNAAYRWDLSSSSATLYALRDIADGEEITITYADPLQTRDDRLKKLEPDYRFTCDCPWCSFSDPLDQEKSDSTRTYLKMYLSTRPSYKKWSRDLCLPDMFVVDSHVAVIPMIIQEGLHALLPVFYEEIARCFHELGNEEQFKIYLDKTLRLVSVSNPCLARELRDLREAGTSHSKWGLRAKSKVNRGKKGAGNIMEDLDLGDMFGSSDSE
ncbi:hypothetical protein BKA70DRAFT_121354 [Coprinopsis sp. MPI-PUGE-AT-0042]|nr:hypothetical protein BKA70DRAFT_121354 [Coprinopsis sp. MPI-PUGE-AT-0042]